MMRRFLVSAFVAGVALSPAAALAQYVVQEPPVVYQNAPMAMQEPSGPLSADEAAEVAMMHGMARVENVDRRIWDGNYKVKGTDSRGEDLVMRIDRMTGEILKIDD
jgi:hypothetical protein